MNNTVLLIILAICSYLLGNVNWAIIISKIKKTDIRTMGSGNPGTLNVSRNLGLAAGLLTFFLDIMKGAIPTTVAFLVFKGKIFEQSVFYISDFAIYLCGLCAVFGHIYPAFLKFKGGKGIASSIGVFFSCQIIFGGAWLAVAIMCLLAAVLFIYFTEFGAMGSFIAITPMAICGSIRLFITYGNASNYNTSVFFIVTNMIIFTICFFTWFAHRKNIERMLAGEEHPTSIKEMVIKMKAKKHAAKMSNSQDNK